MNHTINTQLMHKSIRQFQDKSLPLEVFSVLLDVANRTATSMGMQRFSLIRIRSDEKKLAFSKICNQPYLAKAPEVWMFIVDCYRNARVANEKGLEEPVKNGNMDFFFQGFTDACLAAQNVYLALESLGLGGVLLGSPLNDAKAIIDLLDMPELTFPAVGLAFGYPDEQPALKPRIPMKLKVADDAYQRFVSYSEVLKEYDEKMSKYYDLRNPNKPLPPFTDQTFNHTLNPNPKRKALLKYIKAQGFDMSDIE